MEAGLDRPVLGYEAGRVTGASSRPNQLGLRKWCSEPIALEEPTWVWRRLALRMREDLNHLRGKEPGSTRYHFVGAEICDK